MIEVYQLINKFFTVPAFPFELGLMISVAMILGFLLFPDLKGVGKWAFTLVLFVFFQEWLRATIITSSDITHSNAPIVIDIIGSVVFVLGTGLGAYLSWRLDKRSKQINRRADKVMDLIKNGNLDQITKPLDKQNINQ